MKSNDSARQPDAMLLPFLQTSEEAEEHRHLQHLLAKEALPLIHSIVAKRLQTPLVSTMRRQQSQGEPEAEDVAGEAVALLVARLRACKEDRTLEPIGDFRAYIAVTTHRACDAWLRRKYPLRHRVYNRLRYVLTRQAGLALWSSAVGNWYGGFAAWQDEKRALKQNARLNELRTHPQHFAQTILAARNIECSDPVALLSAIFDWVGHPVALDDLIAIAGDLWNMRDLPPAETAPEAALDPYDAIADSNTNVAEEVQQRVYLQHLWHEIGQLPPRQCAALLLNLRDTQGQDILTLLPLLGIATLGEIAERLGLSVEQFTRLWNDLPLEDAVIAAQLGVTRQQVINLRKVARERLARRSREFEQTL